MSVNIVIDLEMCRVQYRQENYNCGHEIIQIGAVKMNDAFEITDQYSAYIKPQYGKIDRFIASLTGIIHGDVKEAETLSEALEHFLGWTGEHDVRFYSWSSTDYYQMRKEIREKKLDEEAFSLFLDKENWFDYQRKFKEKFELPKLYKLSEALELVELDPEGHLHDGLADAWNTARIIAKLELHPEYRTPLQRFREQEKSYTPLTTSLAEQLKGLKLN